MNNKSFSEFMALVIEKTPNTVGMLRRAFDKARFLDFLAPLLLRLYLVPVFWMAGSKKFTNFSETAEWFGNTEWGLGLPAPYLLVFLVALLETVGALLLLFGLATRLIALPLMVIMVFAAITTHWSNGWLAVATGSGLFATDRTVGAVERLQQAKDILQSQGDFQWLTENGSLVILNNGIEFAATYFIMLLVLFFMGGGRFVSVDYWLVRRYFND
ncbi:MAG: DoxX family protein [Methylomonas sp.]|jgi:uncharacterized membrane protein YphA (DoxX/SURF4 family)|uniref:HvfX family Cu-binding RiPP maturation protein n=1 Tax=Methylomonas sp. TaxID=418 RepID=UPI0025F3B920|nr:DoxX family protein [Methylomonas sp.]MCK9605151.1 DoxX family protein [Methylomonas sp.]